jgi:putative oxidoreductase
MKLSTPFFLTTPDMGLLFLRLSGALLVLLIHGWPKLLNWQTEVQLIDDPLHLGKAVTLACALFAEILCPLAIMAGVWTRLACLPLLFLLLVSMLLVHADWTLEQGQFGWLLIILFSTIALAGPGRYVIFPETKGQAV